MRPRHGPHRSSLNLTSSLSLAAPDPLERFHAAQSGGVYERARAELLAGSKRGHWMWFMFPQLAGLGTSPTARRYAISDGAQARTYLADPVLAPRLRECAAALLALPPGASAERVLGSVDALKLRSSATLFTHVGEVAELTDVLGRFYGGEPDPLTVRLLTPRVAGER